MQELRSSLGRVHSETVNQTVKALEKALDEKFDEILLGSGGQNLASTYPQDAATLPDATRFVSAGGACYATIAAARFRGFSTPSGSPFQHGTSSPGTHDMRNAADGGGFLASLGRLIQPVSACPPLSNWPSRGAKLPAKSTRHIPLHDRRAACDTQMLIHRDPEEQL